MKKFAFFFVALALVLTPALAMAQTGSSGFGTPTGSSGFGTPTGSSGGIQQSSSQTNTSIQNPLTVGSFCGLLKLIFGALVQLGIPVAVIFLILSGARFVFAQGNEKALGDAKRTLYYTVIGIALFLGAWLIVMAVAATLSQLGVTLVSCS